MTCLNNNTPTCLQRVSRWARETPVGGGGSPGKNGSLTDERVRCRRRETVWPERKLGRFLARNSRSRDAQRGCRWKFPVLTACFQFWQKRLAGGQPHAPRSKFREMGRWAPNVLEGFGYFVVENQTVHVLERVLFDLSEIHRIFNEQDVPRFVGPHGRRAIHILDSSGYWNSRQLPAFTVTRMDIRHANETHELLRIRTGFNSNKICICH